MYCSTVYTLCLPGKSILALLTQLVPACSCLRALLYCNARTHHARVYLYILLVARSRRTLPLLHVTQNIALVTKARTSRHMLKAVPLR